MGAYNQNKVPVKPPLKQIHIHLQWDDGYGHAGKQFATVQELADFLKANPVIAEGVGYVSKTIKS